VCNELKYPVNISKSLVLNDSYNTSKYIITLHTLSLLNIYIILLMLVWSN
jgi:hypothetical protein